MWPLLFQAPWFRRPVVPSLTPTPGDRMALPLFSRKARRLLITETLPWSQRQALRGLWVPSLRPITFAFGSSSLQPQYQRHFVKGKNLDET